jgi:hypothetical protein
LLSISSFSSPPTQPKIVLLSSQKSTMEPYHEQLNSVNTLFTIHWKYYPFIHTWSFKKFLLFKFWGLL